VIAHAPLQLDLHIQVLHDDLDEDGGGDPDCEAAAGSGVMIVADLELCKFFRRLLDCRHLRGAPGVPRALPRAIFSGRRRRKSAASVHLSARASRFRAMERNDPGSRHR